MSKKLILVMLLVVGLVGIVQAQETRPLQLALFNPCQMVPENESIRGVSLALFYTVNKDVTGLSLVLLGLNKATGNVQGVELGLGNWVEGFFYGWQAGALNRAGSRFVGFQDGFVNITAGNVTGLQAGIVNWSDGFLHGVQAGIFNYTLDRFIGTQLGVVNVTKGQSSGLDLGIVNYAEGSFKGLQAGLVNCAGHMQGLQLGFVNYTKSLNGLQIGLGNYNGNKQPFEFFPFVNWSF